MTRFPLVVLSATLLLANAAHAESYRAKKRARDFQDQSAVASQLTRRVNRFGPALPRSFRNLPARILKKAQQETTQMAGKRGRLSGDSSSYSHHGSQGKEQRHAIWASNGRRRLIQSAVVKDSTGYRKRAFGTIDLVTVPTIPSHGEWLEVLGNRITHKKYSTSRKGVHTARVRSATHLSDGSVLVRTAAFKLDVSPGTIKQNHGPREIADANHYSLYKPSGKRRSLTPEQYRKLYVHDSSWGL